MLDHRQLRAGYTWNGICDANSLRSPDPLSPYIVSISSGPTIGRSAGHTCVWNANGEGTDKDIEGYGHQPLRILAAAERSISGTTRAISRSSATGSLRSVGGATFVVYRSGEVHAHRRPNAREREHGGEYQRRSGRPGEHSLTGTGP